MKKNVDKTYVPLDMKGCRPIRHFTKSQTHLFISKGITTGPRSMRLCTFFGCSDGITVILVPTLWNHSLWWKLAHKSYLLNSWYPILTNLSSGIMFLSYQILSGNHPVPTPRLTVYYFCLRSRCVSSVLPIRGSDNKTGDLIPNSIDRVFPIGTGSRLMLV